MTGIRSNIRLDIHTWAQRAASPEGFRFGLTIVNMGASTANPTIHFRSSVKYFTQGRNPSNQNAPQAASCPLGMSEPGKSFWGAQMAESYLCAGYVDAGLRSNGVSLNACPDLPWSVAGGCREFEVAKFQQQGFAPQDSASSAHRLARHLSVTV
jgi:hypothetical protein